MSVEQEETTPAPSEGVSQDFAALMAEQTQASVLFMFLALFLQ
jgi:hypothetical protein